MGDAIDQQTTFTAGGRRAGGTAAGHSRHHEAPHGAAQAAPPGAAPPGAQHRAVPGGNRQHHPGHGHVPHLDVPALAGGGNAALARRMTPQVTRWVDTDPGSGECLYRVQPGDTLGEIARDLLGSAARATEILELNGADPSCSADRTSPWALRPGDLLHLPADAAPPTSGPLTSHAPTTGTEGLEPELAPVLARLQNVPLPDHPGFDFSSSPGLDLSPAPGPALGPRVTPGGGADPAAGPLRDLDTTASYRGTPVCGGTPQVEPVTVTDRHGRTISLPLVQLHFPYPSTPWVDHVQAVGPVFIRMRLFTRLAVALFPQPLWSGPLVVENTGILYNTATTLSESIVSDVGLDFAMRPGQAPGLYWTLHAKAGAGVQSTAVLEIVPPNSLAAIWFLRQLLPAEPYTYYRDHQAIARVGGSFMALVDVFPRPMPPIRQEVPVTERRPISPGLAEALRRLRAEHPVVFWSVVGLTGAALVAALISGVGTGFAAEIAAAGEPVLLAALTAEAA